MQNQAGVEAKKRVRKNLTVQEREQQEIELKKKAEEFLPFIKKKIFEILTTKEDKSDEFILEKCSVNYYTVYQNATLGRNLGSRMLRIRLDADAAQEPQLFWTAFVGYKETDTGKNQTKGFVGDQFFEALSDNGIVVKDKKQFVLDQRRACIEQIKQEMLS